MGFYVICRRAGKRGMRRQTTKCMNKVNQILLVDDDVMDQEFFIAALSHIDSTIHYTVAKNGKEALSALESSDPLPSIIFMDIDMPLMNSVECLKHILSNPKTSDIPVIMLTSSGLQRERVKRIGAKGFIVKPDDEKTLVLRIRESVEAEI
jgi:CheY-like chemotaxis protein